MSTKPHVMSVKEYTGDELQQRAMCKLVIAILYDE